MKEEKKSVREFIVETNLMDGSPLLDTTEPEKRNNTNIKLKTLRILSVFISLVSSSSRTNQVNEFFALSQLIFKV